MKKIIKLTVIEESSVDVFRFGDLSESAKNVVRAEWREWCDRSDQGYWDVSDDIASVVAISAILEVDCHVWRGTYCDWHVEFTPRYESVIGGLSGIRALAYIQNHIITPNEKPMRFQGRIHPAPVFDLTGWCVDNDVIRAFQAWKNELRVNPGITYENFVFLVEETLQKTMQAEEDAYHTDEVIDDMIEGNWGNRWFLENGTDVTEDIVE